MRAYRIIGVLMAISLGATAASAQVVWSPDVFGREVSHTNAANPFFTASSIELFDGPLSGGFDWKGDFNLMLDDASDTVYLTGWRSFGVETFPVRWTTSLYGRGADYRAGKLVNGGGDFGDPLTAWSFQAWVEQDDNGLPFDDMIVPGARTYWSTGSSLQGLMIGNGLSYIDGTVTSIDTILAAEHDYMLVFSASIPISSIAEPDQLPWMTLTGEFGALQDGFDGFEIYGRWTAVPEPPCLALLALGSVAFIRRQ